MAQVTIYHPTQAPTQVDSSQLGQYVGEGNEWSTTPIANDPASTEGGGTGTTAAVNPGQLTLRGPNGETQTMPASNPGAIDQLTRSGWIPLNEQGQPYRVVPYMGGQMFVDPTTGQGMPLNGILGEALTPEQQAAMPGFNQLLGYLNEQGTGGGGTGELATPVDFNAMLNLQGIPEIPQINLGQMPTMEGQFSPEWLYKELGPDATTEEKLQNQSYWGQVGNVEGELSKIYQTLQLPQMQAAQMNLGEVPQPKAALPQSFAALQQLLSGEGFDPRTLALMKASSADEIAQQARAQRSSAKLASQQAGLGDSGGSVAMQGQINRRAGDALTGSNRAIDIANAQQGMQNMTTGAGMELNRQTSAAAQANLVALQNASNMLAAMGQNTQNMQAANTANFGQESNRQFAGANAQAQAVGGAGENLNRAQTGLASGAASQNAGNAYNWNLSQANMNQQRNMFNTGTGESRWSQALSGLINLANGTQQANYTNQGNYLTQGMTPSNGWASLTNFGNGVLNRQLGA